MNWREELYEPFYQWLKQQSNDPRWGELRDLVDELIDKTDRPTGEWVWADERKAKKCTNCNKTPMTFSETGEWVPDFCPNCGADNRREINYMPSVEIDRPIIKNGETFTREELTKWLLSFVHKNSVLGKQCERLIKRLDDFETFVADMRGE